MCRAIMMGGAMLFSVLVWGTFAWANPMVSIDMDPSTAVIQSSLTVNQGDIFTVDVVILSLGGLKITNLTFDMEFDPSILTAESVDIKGSFSGWSTTENDTDPPDVNLTASGTEVGGNTALPFASITFTASGAGLATLNLTNVEAMLKDELGVSFTQSLSSNNGTVTVSAVPEPTGVLLFGSGLVSLGLYRWWKTRRDE